MQGVREVLRGTLSRSLRSLSEEDRLAAAWAVACGPALAARAEVLGLDEDRVLHVQVLEPGWRDQFVRMRLMLTEDLRKIAGVRLQTIHFEGAASTKARGREAVPAEAKKPAAKATNARAKERRKS